MMYQPVVMLMLVLTQFCTLILRNVLNLCNDLSKLHLFRISYPYASRSSSSFSHGPIIKADRGELQLYVCSASVTCAPACVIRPV